MFDKFFHVPRKIIFEYHPHRDGNFALPCHPSQRREPDYTSDDTRVEAATAQQARYRTDPDREQDHVTLTTRCP